MVKIKVGFFKGGLGSSIIRVLCLKKVAAIHLDLGSLLSSSNLPALSADHTIEGLFDLAPSGVYRADKHCCCRGALLPHPFTLTGPYGLRRSTLCCTSRKLTLPRRYLAPCPMEPGLSSPVTVCYQSTLSRQRLPEDPNRAIIL